MTNGTSNGTVNVDRKKKIDGLNLYQKVESYQYVKLYGSVHFIHLKHFQTHISLFL